MKVGDLIYVTKSMLEMGYPEVGIVVGIKNNRYVIGFPTGIVQPFHPRWVRDKPIKRRNNGRKS